MCPGGLHLRTSRFTIQLLAGLAVGLFATVAAGLPLGIRVLEPEQVLRDRSQVGRDGILYFQDQQGTLRRFVTSIDDPAIVNQGDGLFHPAPAPFVLDAIESADTRFLTRIRFDVFILPYPVADPLGSWADGGAIYLSPGVRALSDRQVDFLISHETGHLVHRTFLPDSDQNGWALYRAIRGIEDTTRYNAGSVHRDRPHEIFAEDFRTLFGSNKGAGADAIENPDLLDPFLVPGLREFFLGLIGETIAEPVLAAFAYPNPIAAGEVLSLALPNATAPQLEIFDVQGRSIRALNGLQPKGDGSYALLWDGKDDAGRTIPHGAYYCLVRDGAARTRIPVRFIR
jgi:hypothetical protein